MLSLSAHKFHGPKGVGALYVRKGPCACPRSSTAAARSSGHRAGTENVARRRWAWAAAMREAVDGPEPGVPARLAALRDRLIDGTAGDSRRAASTATAVKRLPGNVNLSFEGVEGEALLLHLDAGGHLRFLRLGLHLRLPGPQPRAAGHRPAPRDRPRLPAPLPGRRTPPRRRWTTCSEGSACQACVRVSSRGACHPVRSDRDAQTCPPASC